jgi:hypothetical protein
MYCWCDVKQGANDDKKVIGGLDTYCWWDVKQGANDDKKVAFPHGHAVTSKKWNYS